MNYRHSYHAGNFADALKHIVLVMCLEYLQKKDAALCVIDTHAGAGLYDLKAEEATKTGEWERGVGLLRAGIDAPDDLQLYLNLIRGDLAHGRYPGSPLMISRMLRPHDRLIANELHEQTASLLRALFESAPNVGTMQIDAYECVRAHVPPVQKRGLVLIDPPFEQKNEFDTLARQMREWKKRWPTGVYVVWYPIKAHLAVDALKDAAHALALPRTWFVEALVCPRKQPLSFNGCGLLLFNTPYTIPERMQRILPFLEQAMQLHDTASGWIVPDTNHASG